MDHTYRYNIYVIKYSVVDYLHGYIPIINITMNLPKQRAFGSQTLNERKPNEKRGINANRRVINQDNLN